MYILRKSKREKKEEKKAVIIRGRVETPESPQIPHQTFPCLRV